MKKTLEILNTLLEKKIISEYTICGGIAHFYYIEPSVTYDLDIIIGFGSTKNQLAPLSDIYEWARQNNYEIKDEHIIIGDLPVQFLPAYNKLVEEALENSTKIVLFDTETSIIKPEYLMAIMLQTNRPKDRERMLQFLNYVDYSQELLENLLKKYILLEKFISFKKKYIDE